jgi:hypothetical protein
MVQIKAYTIADLRSRLELGPWFEGDPIPITRERALSLINNPRAETSDVALMVAYDDDSVIGHLGIMTDLVFNGDQQYKIGWLTVWWANPDHKYTGTGLLLLMRAFGFYGGGLGASGFSEDAKRVYAATKKFKTIQELQGISAFVRMDLSHLLPKRLPVLAKVRTLLRCVDAAANCLVGVRQCLWRRKHALPAGCRLEYVPELDAEAGAFLERHQSNALSRRGDREINWIARYSWMACAPLNPPPPFRFATTAQSHRNFHLKVYDSSRHLVAVLHLSVIDDHLVIPCCCHNDQADLVARIIGHHLVALRLKRITTYRGELVGQFARLGFPWVFQVRRTRSWILSGPAAALATKTVATQDGDGDCAFTV